MGESIWCNVQVATPLSWGDDGDKIPGVAMIADALINGFCNERVEADRRIWNINGEGNYGLSDDDVAAGLTWLTEHGVPYDAHSEPKYEMSGERDVFDGVQHYERECNEGGSVTLGSYRWNELKAMPDPIAAVDAHFAMPEIEAMDISHLPAECPQLDEEEA